jgi:hypothetical protein
MVFLFYYAVAGDGWPAANTYFEVEFGQCNDQRFTGASFRMVFEMKLAISLLRHRDKIFAAPHFWNLVF